MNHFFKILLILSATIAFFSCSDEFVNEKLTISGVAASAIIISPEWEADDYKFQCQGVANADFTITSKPEWLILDSHSGKITDSVATIHGFVNPDPRFSKIGFYVDQMMIRTSGKKYAVPVYYITEGTPAVEVNRTFHVTSSDADNQLLLSNSGHGILIWDIVSVPDWLTVNPDRFNPSSLILGKGDLVSLPLIFHIREVMQNNLNGTIVLKTNDKNNPLIQIAVKASLGTPRLIFYNQQMDFGFSETTKISQVYNQGSGILFWNFEGLPDWLSVSTTGGKVMSLTNSSDFTFTCLRGNLQPGQNTATFYLKSNDPDQPSMPITVTARAAIVNANIKALEGNILDAAFDKSTNTLYYVTGQPNKLVAYDVTARTVLREVALSKAPTCLAMTDDFKKALVGHGGLISNIDLTTFQVSKTYELDATVYDLEWALNDWFCYTNTTNSNFNLLWINSITGENYQSPQSPMNYSLGTADLRKIPNQPYLVASSRNTSPTGIFVFDLKTKTIKSYTHTSIGNAWFFRQGEFMATGASSIMRTSAVIATRGFQIEGPASIGEIKAGQYANVSWWLDFSEVNHSIWALFSQNTHSYQPPVKGAIYQFEDNDFTLVKTITYDDLYQPDSPTTAYEVEARYVFANSAATELSVLRKGVNNTNWSIEFISVQ